MFRKFSSSVAVPMQADPPGCKAVMSSSTMSGLLQAVVSLKPSPQEAVSIMDHCIKLKTSNDAKFRGRIPIEVVRVVSQAVEDSLESLSPTDITTLVVGVGDNSKSMDEYLMYLMARTLTHRINEVDTDQLVRMVETYCRRDLCDEDLLNAIVSRLISPALHPSLPQLISILRCLSLVKFRHDELIGLITTLARKAPKLLGKDAISLLIAMAELDIHHPTLTTALWAKVAEHKLILSHDDEFGLLFAFLTLPHRWPSLPAVVDRIVKDDRIRNRMNLLSDCIASGVVPPGFAEGVTLPPKLPTRSKRGHPVSSGLHREVANSLEGIGLDPKHEVPTSSFIIDILVSPRSYPRVVSVHYSTRTRPRLRGQAVSGSVPIGNVPVE